MQRNGSPSHRGRFGVVERTICPQNHPNEDDAMRVGISLTSNHHPDVTDPRQAARWMIERAVAARRAALDSLFVGDQHASPTPYYQNTPMVGRLLAEWGEAPAGCLFLLPLWHPVLVAEQIGTLAAIARGPFIMQCGLGWALWAPTSGRVLRLSRRLST
jgi:alkanesulfonate monooxygenase SsuD/methylene tetrahydromethanopterin reductase-like flavin-dependent oxidoreductase (luciferase family)